MGTGKNHVKEAQNRGITCGITCADDPLACEEKQLCTISTTLQNGKKVWQGDFAKDYISEAQKRRLTCGVKEIKFRVCTNLCDPYWWDCVFLGQVKSEVKSTDDVNLLQKYGVRPLHMAVKFATSDIVQFLLDAGADPKIKDDLGWTPLHYLTDSSPLSLEQQLANVELLLDNGANVMAKNNKGATPFDSINDSSPITVGSQLYNVLNPDYSSCIKNHYICTKDVLCRLATEKKNGKTIWKTGHADKYASWAKKRELTCGMTCFSNPEVCEVEVLCALSTQIKDGSLVWQGDYAKNFVDEAKGKNYQCAKSFEDLSLIHI